jgi:hypothetical protein
MPPLSCYTPCTLDYRGSHRLHRISTQGRHSCPIRHAANRIKALRATPLLRPFRLPTYRRTSCAPANRVRPSLFARLLSGATHSMLGFRHKLHGGVQPLQAGGRCHTIKPRMPVIVGRLTLAQRLPVLISRPKRRLLFSVHHGHDTDSCLCTVLPALMLSASGFARVNRVNALRAAPLATSQVHPAQHPAPTVQNSAPPKSAPLRPRCSASPGYPASESLSDTGLRPIRPVPRPAIAPCASADPATESRSDTGLRLPAHRLPSL